MTDNWVTDRLTKSVILGLSPCTIWFLKFHLTFSIDTDPQKQSVLSGRVGNMIPACLSLRLFCKVFRACSTSTTGSGKNIPNPASFRSFLPVCNCTVGDSITVFLNSIFLPFSHERTTFTTKPSFVRSVTWSAPIEHLHHAPVPPSD